MEPGLVIALIVMVVLGVVSLLVSIRPDRELQRPADRDSLKRSRAVVAAADQAELPPGVLHRREDIETRCPRCGKSPAVCDTERAGWDDQCDRYWCRSCGHEESGTPRVMGCGVSFWSQEETDREAAMHRRWSATDRDAPAGSAL
jgi:hypothetical protein